MFKGFEGDRVEFVQTGGTTGSPRYFVARIREKAQFEEATAEVGIVGKVGSQDGAVELVQVVQGEVLG